jgi:hypothetical protein
MEGLDLFVIIPILLLIPMVSDPIHHIQPLLAERETASTGGWNDARGHGAPLAPHGVTKVTST